ncbi:MAG: AMP-binding protein [Microbacteriaceae bacterium]
MFEHGSAIGALHTLGSWPTQQAAEHPQRTAIHDRGVSLSYGELEQRSTALAQSFQKRGYGVGDRIATVTGNSADHIILFFACAKAGLILAPMSWRLSPVELADQFRRAEPHLLVIEEEFHSLVAAALELLLETPSTTAFGMMGLEYSLPERRGKTPAIHREVRDSDPLLLIYTSGTESQSKGALLTHDNCFWNNLALSRTIPLNEDDVVLAILPQFHVGGWNIHPLLALWVGATVVLERVFDAGRILQLIRERRVTTMMAVPTQYLMLTEHPDFSSTDLGTLKNVQVGGASMPEPLIRIWHEQGVKLSQGYGLTENSPNVLSLHPDDAMNRVGWSGKPYAYVEVALTDPVTSEILEGPAVGELLVRGPSVFAGYYADPVATAAILKNGWLHTGDLLQRDDAGYYRIVDRIKEIYISGGENVSPSEVEAALLLHPGVSDVAIIGVPDGVWGEVGVGYVVPRRGVPVDTEALMVHCRKLLAHYKVPKEIIYLDELPKNALGKISRGKLRIHYHYLSQGSAPTTDQTQAKEADAS